MVQLATILPLALLAAGSEASFASVGDSWRSAGRHVRDAVPAERAVAVTAPLVLRPITSQRNTNFKVRATTCLVQ